MVESKMLLKGFEGVNNWVTAFLVVVIFTRHNGFSRLTSGEGH